MIPLAAVAARRVEDASTLAWLARAGCTRDTGGAFLVRSRSAPAVMLVVATTNGGWDHVSVRHIERCPTWDEMEQVKHLFFEPNETAMQLHVPCDRHVNLQEYCLHLWRPQAVLIPCPPVEMV